MSTEPSLALQEAVRSRLLDTPAVIAQVAPNNIRDSGIRQDQFPVIIIGDGQTVHEGTYPGRRNVTVYLDIHVWTGEGGQSAAKAIANDIWTALTDAPLSVPGFDLDDGYHVDLARFIRDPAPEVGHVVLNTHAFMSGEIG